MKLTKLILSGSLLTLTLGAVAQNKAGNAATEKKIEQSEKDAWQAWKDHNAKPFEAILTDDAVNITPQGMQHGKADMLKELAGTSCDVKSFNLSDFHFQWIDKDAVTVMYTAEQDATCSGNKLPAKIWASSVWHNQGGKWVSPFHQETVAQ